MSWTLMEARIDWITCTAGTGQRGTDLLDAGLRIVATEHERGNPRRTSNFEGYHGTITKHAFAGWRLDGACVRLGGELARDHWRSVSEPGTNITRLDLAITGRSEPPDANVASISYNALPPDFAVRGRPTEYTLIQARLGGETLYCGRRASERFGRIYDKGRESRGEYPEGTWRFEIEYKGQAAKDVASYLRSRADIEQAIVGVVSMRFEEWRVQLPDFNVSDRWRDVGRKARTDNETRMKWLSESVRASIEKISTSYSGEEIRTALGLTVPNWVAGETRAHVLDQLAESNQPTT